MSGTIAEPIGVTLVKVAVLKWSLQLFGEGGGAGGAAGGEGAGTGGDAGAAAQAQTGTGSPAKSGAREDLSQVVYGRQEAGAEESPKEESPEQPEAKPKKATFDELLKDPEYKAEFQKRFDKQFNKRFAEQKASSEREAKLAPMLNLLAAKYGTKAGDYDALAEAINSDNDLIERQAYDMGMEPDTYREYNRVMAENRMLKEAEAERQRQTQVNETYNQWVAQAEQARQIYPGLDLKAEVQNPQFAQLLGAGIDVATAYQVVHMGELSTQLVQRAAAEAKENTVKAIQAKAQRPRENGAASPRAATVKSDPKQLSRNDFEELIRRSARGDRIRY